jgi:hypothetical protein
MKTFPASLMFLIVLRAFSAHAGEATGSMILQTMPPPMWAGFYAEVNAESLWNNTNSPTAVD